MFGGSCGTKVMNDVFLLDLGIIDFDLSFVLLIIFLILLYFLFQMRDTGGVRRTLAHCRCHVPVMRARVPMHRD